MSNMSYCRFENTYHDLADCSEHMEDDDLSPTEQKFRHRIVTLCKRIVDDWDDMHGDEEGTF